MTAFVIKDPASEMTIEQFKWVFAVWVPLDTIIILQLQSNLWQVNIVKKLKY